MDLRNSGRRAVKAAEDGLLLVDPRETKVKLRGRGCETQVCVFKGKERHSVNCRVLEAGQPAATVDMGGSCYQ